MDLNSVMEQLKALGSEQVRALAVRNGAGENQFGVKSGDLRTLAKQIKTNQVLAMELWESGNSDAMLLAILIMSPKQISRDQLEPMERAIPSVHVADWFNSYILKLHPEKESLREDWMNSDHPMVARAGWSLTAERVVKSSTGLDLIGLLDRVESEMGAAPSLVQWTMNYVLAEIGINFPEHRARALAIGEALGVFRDYPVSKGCTSPFAPIWINEMVKRQG